MSKLDDPCPHPSRDGKHELYGSTDGLYCKACGATSKEATHTFHPNPDYSSEVNAEIKSWHDPQNGANNAIKALASDPAKWKAYVEAEIEKWQHRPLADVVHDEVRFVMPTQSMESDEVRKVVLELRKLAKTSPYGQSTFWPVNSRGTISGRMSSSEPEMQFLDPPPCGGKPERPWPLFVDYRELELRILTADGYTFTEKPDGSIGDGDLSWPSMQAFLDSRDRGRGGIQWAIQFLAGTEMSEEEIVAQVKELRVKHARG